MEQKNTPPNLIVLEGIWRRLTKLASMSNFQIILVAGTATLAAFSELFTIALLQPAITLFSGASIEDQNLFFVQAKLVAFLQSMDSKERIITLLALLIFLQILREFFLFLAEYQSIRIRTNFEFAIRKKTYEKCLKIPISKYLSTSSGNFHSIVNSYPRSSAGYVFSVVSIIPTVIMLSVYVLMMIRIEWKLFALVVFVSILIFLFMKFAYSKQSEYGTAMREGLVDTSTKANEIIHALPVIRSFARESQSLNSYLNIAGNFLSASAKSSYLNSALGPIQRIISFVLILGAIVAYYTFSSQDEQEFLSTLILFMFILTRINGPLTTLNLLRAGLSQLYPTIKDMLKFLDSEEERQGGWQLQSSFETLEFENVSFAYETGTQIINEIDLSVKKGEFVAIVGPSGAGKSTITNLISGFEIPSSGNIRINDRDLNKCDLQVWRKKISIVPQKPYLFDVSIIDNIRYGRPDATFEEIHQAATLANVLDVIEQTPDGFESLIGEGGNNLSGGQLQRLAIARAIVAKPEILILDEATSAQDSNSESKIKETIEFLRETMSFVVIAHRLSTIVNADKIIVLDKGRIIETGTHSHLLKANGLYSQLYLLSIKDDERSDLS